MERQLEFCNNGHFDDGFFESEVDNSTDLTRNLDIERNSNVISVAVGSNELFVSSPTLNEVGSNAAVEPRKITQGENSVGQLVGFLGLDCECSTPWKIDAVDRKIDYEEDEKVLNGGSIQGLGEKRTSISLESLNFTRNERGDDDYTTHEPVSDALLEWSRTQQEKLIVVDNEERRLLAEIREAAKQDLTEFYRSRMENIHKRKAANRQLNGMASFAGEEYFIKNEETSHNGDLVAKTECFDHCKETDQEDDEIWKKIVKAIDLTKRSTHKRDISRFKDILIDLSSSKLPS